MTTALNGLHHDHIQSNPLLQFTNNTVVIGVVASILAAVALSEKLSSSPTDTTKFQLW